MGSVDMDASSNSTNDSGGGRPMIPRQKPSSFSVEDAPGSQSSRIRRVKTCLWASLAAFIAIAVVLMILGFTVFKERRPVTTVESITLKDVDASVSLGGLGGFHLNLSLGVNISIYNPNRLGRFKYTNSSTHLEYRGKDVGEAPIPAGHISARETMHLSLTLVLMADQFFSDSRALLSDVIGGTLPLSAASNISGKVTLLHLIKIHVKSYSRCNFSVTISNRSVSDYSCTYKTKLK